MNDFKYYNHLGFHNPYYIKVNKKFLIDSEISVLLNKIDNKNIDYSAIVQILSTGYAFGDRTLIKEIKKSPWMSKPNKDLTEWEYYNAPRHLKNKVIEDDSSTEFYHLLEEELFNYIKDHQHIGILLTGGMDSRIVAAVLNNLITQKKLTDKKVTSYTWGSEDSRDVIYAKRIADMFGWHWKHLIVDVDQMNQNYKTTIKNGCEFTPIHLHAMSKVAEEKSLDCVLAGSFGDSIGRGEYSGIKVKDLKSIKLKIKNPGGILRNDYVSKSKLDIDFDIEFYHNKFPEIDEYQLNEQDLQLHYMRRMLNPCMAIIDKKIPLYQMFSSPKVFGYIWSIDPELRTDDIYKKLLEKFSPNLLEIPWARTGLKYPNTEGISDKYKKRHHDYGKMIRNHFLDHIKDVVIENKIIAKKLFNYNNLIRLINNCKKYPMQNNFTYEEKLLWIACLLEFIKTNNINVDLPEEINQSIFNNYKNDLEYKLKYLYKKFRK